MYRTGDLVRQTRRRQLRLPRPHRRPGQDPRLPGRAGRGGHGAVMAHPDVATAAVVADADRRCPASSAWWPTSSPAEDAGGDAGTGRAAAEAAQVDEWQEIYDAEYREIGTAARRRGLLGLGQQLRRHPDPARRDAGVAGRHRRADPRPAPRGGCWRSASARACCSAAVAPAGRRLLGHRPGAVGHRPAARRRRRRPGAGRAGRAAVPARRTTPTGLPGGFDVVVVNSVDPVLPRASTTCSR